MIVFGDGRVDAGKRSARMVGGAVLDAVAEPAGRGALLLMEDGTVRLVRADLSSHVVCTVTGGWADRLAVDRPSGLIAIATSRTVEVHRLADGAAITRVTPHRAPGAMFLRGTGPGVALLAMAHGGGISLVDLANSATGPVLFEAVGGHGGVTVSPDGQFLLASSSEPALIGFRLRDRQGFRMGGFPAKPDGLVWTPSGELATTGGPAVLVWPFDPLEGPMGQSARVLRSRMGMVTALAARRTRIAAGLSDGGVDLVDTASGRTAHVAGPPPPAELDFDPRLTNCRITSLAFSPDGRLLAWCGEDGASGVAVL